MRSADSRTYMRWLLAVVAAVTLAACASMGRPQGGAVDEAPPVYVRSNPRPGQLNVSHTRFDIIFDENITVEDAMNKIVVSPAQQQPPSVQANGRRLTLELRDTLKPDMTYTIDFADAVRDLNEGNILDGFAIDFATGDRIDSLRISGMLFEARTLEPAQGMLVGVYDTDADSTVTTTPMLRIAKTDQLGRFTIRGLKEGRYRVWAINDVNRDYHWDRSEDVAFYDGWVSPSTEVIEVTDTLRSSLGLDSLTVRPGVRFLPNDILLTWFNEDYRPQYLVEYKRPDSTTVTLTFAAPSDTLPELTIVDGALSGRRLDEVALLERNLTGDTLKYWLRDPSVISDDSLRVAARYLKTDTLDRLTWTCDTLRLGFRRPKPRKHKADEDSVPLQHLNLTAGTGGRQDLYLPMRLQVDRPLERIDTAGIALAVKRDTLWIDLPRDSWTLSSDTVRGSLLTHYIHSPWQPGGSYRLTVDSAAVTSIYGLHNAPLIQEFTVTTPEDYSTLRVTPTRAPEGVPLIFELLNGSDEPVMTVHTEPGATALFEYVTPGTYYLRAVADVNGNGVWDTGNVAARLMPEDVYYYPRKLNLRQNWDVTQTWDMEEFPVDMQKPDDIKKNRPKTRDDNRRNRTDDEEDEEDGFDNNMFNTGGRDTQYNNVHR